MHAIGVDIGGTKIAAGVVDEDGRILAQTRRDTDPADSASVDAGVIEACRELAAGFEVGAIGLAAPGFISADRSTVLYTPNLPWRDHPLKANVEAVLGTDAHVVVENDANAAAWAEFVVGAGRGTADLLMLTIGTGLGSGLIANGQLVRGAWGVAGEMGHMRVVPNGHPCGCGRFGCWEQYASGSALVRHAREAAVEQPDRAAAVLARGDGTPDGLHGPQLTAAAQEGDPFAVEMLAWLGRWIGEGAAQVAAVSDPALVVVGGGVSAAGDLLLGPARDGFREQLPARGHRPEAPFVVATLGNDAGIVGAADLARVALTSPAAASA